MKPAPGHSDEATDHVVHMALRTLLVTTAQRQADLGAVLERALESIVVLAVSEGIPPDNFERAITRGIEFANAEAGEGEMLQ